MPVNLEPGGRLTLEAALALDGPCAFVAPTFVSPFNQ